MEKDVDIRGLVCPAPVIEMTKTAKQLKQGDSIKIIMSPDGKTNVEGWANGNDFKITDFKKMEDKVVFTLDKN